MTGRLVLSCKQVLADYQNNKVNNMNKNKAKQEAMRKAKALKSKMAKKARG